jgi:predicted GIY-YIG superfamily endonuclease
MSLRKIAAPAPTGEVGTTYLICFHAEVGPKDAPAGHRAGHYIGWTGNGLEDRLASHQEGRGSSLMAEVARQGIGWTVVATWENSDRHFERSLKDRGSAKRWCPNCAGEIWVEHHYEVEGSRS